MDDVAAVIASNDIGGKAPAVDNQRDAVIIELFRGVCTLPAVNERILMADLELNRATLEGCAKLLPIFRGVRHLHVRDTDRMLPRKIQSSRSA